MTVRAVALVVMMTATASADDGFLRRLVDDTRGDFDKLAAARAPRLAPPKPVALRKQWKKLGSLELGAPLVALAGANLDGGRRGELYAVTTQEVAAIGLDKRPHVIASVKLAGEPAVPQPRDVVGATVVDGGALVASVSSWARGLRVTRQNGQLAATPAEPGFELCAGERVQLAPGRNYFGTGTSAVYAVRCRNDLVDAGGHPLHVRAEVSTANRLEVAVETCDETGTACKASGKHVIADVGAVFEIADLDRDGVPEVIHAGAGAPGDPDGIRVIALGDDARKPKLVKKFSAGGVAGIAVTDLDGDGVEDVVVAVRLLGSSRIDLWRLE